MINKLKVGDQAPSAVVKNVADESVALESLWADGPTLLTFLRHFG